MLFFCRFFTKELYAGFFKGNESVFENHALSKLIVKRKNILVVVLIIILLLIILPLFITIGIFPLWSLSLAHLFLVFTVYSSFLHTIQRLVLSPFFPFFHNIMPSIVIINKITLSFMCFSKIFFSHLCPYLFSFHISLISASLLPYHLSLQIISSSTSIFSLPLVFRCLLCSNFHVSAPSVTLLSIAHAECHSQ